ncbi:polyprenyl synthetase family protein [Chitinophaga sancti]|uniref:Octaprenyl-diphosphate synthase n=1 Tax=Chitinophaga sancti TaxID=1004 RepID=A0A1K1PC91_9BACT|nr:polyprenyl synthetase family protein [Chitinophaga sancti]WQD65768.1 polyprenyl synthetase family protein [Chitinophaga sancti]WQG88610.1 polyprenyl synthetase family protein [Chitinophaga sancti]SFW45418.1 octaprenyl-diphosphate synthase [Chitinophaga sancti]
MDEIKNLISKELRDFESKFSDAVKSNVALLDRIMHYIVKRKGKQMRPMFVLLSARLFSNDIQESTYRAAALVELLHTATLVHDDVVDDANERRGFFSINALWKNKIAVLVGDYLLSKGLLLSLNNNDFRALQILSQAVKEMSEGELLQIEKTRKLNIKEDIYFEIIRRKTASLLAAACAAGAWSTSNDDETTEKMRLFGEKVGVAFQIKDDLFDYGSEKIGKPTGIDIREKKMTLPLIYTLEHATPEVRRRIINIVKNHNTDKTRVEEVITLVKTSGGIEYTQKKMFEYRDEAMAILHSFPDSNIRQGLESMVRYTTDRNF